MSYKRFFALAKDNGVFRFQIDTTKIIVGATNGSQLDNKFILPIQGSLTTQLILKVNDGRNDLIINNSVSLPSDWRTLTFATPGIYEITLIGRGLINFFYSPSVDITKITKVYECSESFPITALAFADCSNLIWDASFAKVLSLDRVFRGILGFGPNADLSKYDVSAVTGIGGVFTAIQTPPTTVFSGFFLNLTSATNAYRGANLILVSELQLIAPNLTSVQSLFYQGSFQGRLVIKSEALTNITFMLRQITTAPPSLGEVDIRRVTQANTFIGSGMTVNNTDSTLLGWVNNFDWSVIPSITDKVTLDFYNSKYSNNASVIAAKAFLESKGIKFTRLTMV